MKKLILPSLLIVVVAVVATCDIPSPTETSVSVEQRDPAAVQATVLTESGTVDFATFNINEVRGAVYINGRRTFVYTQRMADEVARRDIAKGREPFRPSVTH